MSAQVELRSNSPAQTLEIGTRLGALLRGGELIALCGPLGAGKTQLTKGLALGLGVSEGTPVVSPTFVLLRGYQGRLFLNHLDVYRLRDLRELEAIGFDELRGQPDGVVVVEWADRFPELVSQSTLTIELDHGDVHTRRIDISVADPALRGALPGALQDWARS